MYMYINYFYFYSLQMMTMMRSAGLRGGAVGLHQTLQVRIILHFSLSSQRENTFSIQGLSDLSVVYFCLCNGSLIT